VSISRDEANGRNGRAMQNQRGGRPAGGNTQRPQGQGRPQGDRNQRSERGGHRYPDSRAGVHQARPAGERPAPQQAHPAGGDQWARLDNRPAQGEQRRGDTPRGDRTQGDKPRNYARPQGKFQGRPAQGGPRGGNGGGSGGQRQGGHNRPR
jgi:ATP-dependent RNA helicase RhlE